MVLVTAYRLCVHEKVSKLFVADITKIFVADITKIFVVVFCMSFWLQKKVK